MERDLGEIAKALTMVCTANRILPGRVEVVDNRTEIRVGNTESDKGSEDRLK